MDIGAAQTALSSAIDADARTPEIAAGSLVELRFCGFLGERGKSTMAAPAEISIAIRIRQRRPEAPLFHARVADRKSSGDTVSLQCSVSA